MTRKVLIVGGGHNGLVAAAVLAKAGRDVTVLESRPTLGGLAGSASFAEGYRTAGVLADTSGFRDEVADALKLQNYGLRRLDARPPISGVSEDGTPIRLRYDRVEGPFDQAECERYTLFRVFITRLQKLVRHLTRTYPINPLGAWWPLLSVGARVRRLGAQDMTELLRIAPMCVGDWMRDALGDERLRALVAHPALIGLCAGPWSPWSATNLLFHECTISRPVKGGAPALIEALRQVAQANGAQLRTGAKVDKILVKASGVYGVSLCDGEVIEATTVASSVDPRQTFEGLIGVSALPVRLATDVRRIRTRGTTAVLHLALSGPLRDRDGDEISALRTGDSLDMLERAYDCVKYGELPTRPMLDVQVPTQDDPSLVATPGHHVATLLVHHVPFDLADGWSEKAREELIQRSLHELERAAPGARGQVVGRQLLTPPDLQRDYGLSGGHIYHGEHAPDQLLFLRPTIQCSKYATPVRGLYLVGSGSHPGGGITGMPGYLGAKTILSGRG